MNCAECSSGLLQQGGDQLPRMDEGRNGRTKTGREGGGSEGRGRRKHDGSTSSLCPDVAQWPRVITLPQETVARLGYGAQAKARMPGTARRVSVGRVSGGTAYSSCLLCAVSIARVRGYS